MTSEQPRILLYILRRDVRLSDNPIFHTASLQISRPNSRSSSNPDKRHRDDSLTSEHGAASFTHLLPVYVYPANQIEVSGFLSSPTDESPYPEARSDVAHVWRTGPHRAKFVAEGVWDLKEKLEGLKCGSGLEQRVGTISDVVSDMFEWYAKNENEGQISEVWMTDDYGTEEKRDERRVRDITAQYGVNFKIWYDEKFYIDE
jgi:deoxyribodipyrimidine photo-lyase